MNTRRGIAAAGHCSGPPGRHQPGRPLIARCGLAGVLAAVALIAAACGSPSIDAAPTTTSVQPTTPDGIAAAFADAYSAGDTPVACTYTSGAALKTMTDSGWCQHANPWPAVAYWSGQHCDYPDGMGDYSGMRLFAYKTNGTIAQSPDFLVGVTGSGTTWKVTFLGQDGPGIGAANRLCSIVATTGPTS